MGLKDKLAGLFGKKAAPRSPEVALEFERGMESLRMLTDMHVRNFGLDECGFDVDLEEGKIWFANADGRRAEAPVQVVGTVDLSNNSWLWGWDHPSV